MGPGGQRGKHWFYRHLTGSANLDGQNETEEPKVQSTGSISTGGPSPRERSQRFRLPETQQGSQTVPYSNILVACLTEFTRLYPIGEFPLGALHSRAN